MAVKFRDYLNKRAQDDNFRTEYEALLLEDLHGAVDFYNKTEKPKNLPNFTNASPNTHNFAIFRQKYHFIIQQN